MDWNKVIVYAIRATSAKVASQLEISLDSTKNNIYNQCRMLAEERERLIDHESHAHGPNIHEVQQCTFLLTLLTIISSLCWIFHAKRSDVIWLFFSYRLCSFFILCFQKVSEVYFDIVIQMRVFWLIILSFLSDFGNFQIILCKCV